MGLLQKTFIEGGYYLMLLLAALWAVQAVRAFGEARSDVRVFFRQWWPGLLVCAALAASVFVSTQPYFRVLPDETNLLSASQAMTDRKEAYLAVSGLWYNKVFHPLDVEVPVRPLFFPFLLSLVHTVLGFRPENAFVLNFMAFFALLFLVFREFRLRTGSDAWGAAAAFLVASQPVIVQAATSGGFDLLSLVVFAATLLSVRWYLASPSAVRLELVIVQLFVLANIRYEGTLFLVLVPAALFLTRKISRKSFASSSIAVYALAPVFLFGVTVSKFLAGDGFGIEGPAFSAAFAAANVPTFFRMTLVPSLYYPYAAVVDWAGLIGAAYFAWAAAVRRIAVGALGAIAAGCVGVYAAVHFFYTWGRADHPVAARLFILYAAIFSLSAAALLYQVPLFRKRPVYALLAAAAAFAFYQPIAMSSPFPSSQRLSREFDRVRAFLDEEARFNRDFVVVSDRPYLYAALRYGAMGFEAAETGDLLPHALQRGTVRNVFVVQTLKYGAAAPEQRWRLDRFKLEPIVEFNEDRDTLTRISRVVK